MTNSLPWYRWPIEIDGLPNLKMVIFHSYGDSLPEGKSNDELQTMVINQLLAHPYQLSLFQP